MARKNDILLKFNNISRCGYYKSASFEGWEEISETFDNLRSLVGKRTRLTDTGFAEHNEIEEGTIISFCHSIHKNPHTASFLVTLWNANLKVNNQLLAIKRDAKIGETKLVKQNLTDLIPGSPTYYWILPDLRKIVSVGINLASTKKDFIEKYMFNFLASSKDDDRNDPKWKSLYPDFKLRASMLSNRKWKIIQKIDEITSYEIHISKPNFTTSRFSNMGINKFLNVFDHFTDFYGIRFDMKDEYKAKHVSTFFDPPTPSQLDTLIDIYENNATNSLDIAFNFGRRCVKLSHAEEKCFIENPFHKCEDIIKGDSLLRYLENDRPALLAAASLDDYDFDRNIEGHTIEYDQPALL